MRNDKGKHEKAKRQPQAQQSNPPDTGQQPDREHGEGNYKATRQYDDATTEFVKSGRVEDAAAKANPRNPRDQEEMKDAEQAGRDRSKGEDPQLHKKSGHKASDPD